MLDASAVLVLLQDETGANMVEDAIDEGALISAVNLSEVLVKLSDAGASTDAAADLIVSLFVEVSPFGLESAREGARIRSIVRSAGLSLGDRACLALARTRDLPVITADRAWLDHAEDLRVEVHSVR